MTFNNWKELCIGGNKLKRLVRVSDGLVLFELPSGPDYNEPFWIKGDGSSAFTSRCYLIAGIDPSTLPTIYRSTDKKNWTPISWDYDGYTWNHMMKSTPSVEKFYYMRDSEVPIGFTTDAGIKISSPFKGYKDPHLTIGGNINSLLCKNFADLKDISGLDNCFGEAIIAESIFNADALLLPAESIGLSCYNQIVSQFDATLTSFGVEVPVENIPSYGCCRMLYNSKKLVNGPKFPNLKSIGDYGMQRAFFNTSSMESVEFPSTEISVGIDGFNEAFANSGIKKVGPLNLYCNKARGCKGMFYRCHNLEEVNGLSATYLAGQSLSGMFSNCSALTSVNDLYLDGSALSSTNITFKCTSMFQNCKAMLSVSGMISGIAGSQSLRYMFQNCKSLKDASKLSVEANYGIQYAQQMFDGCSELESMPMLLSGKQGASNFKYQNAFRDCKKLKNVNPLPDVRPYAGMYQNMFRGCTSMTDAPEIMLSSAAPRNCMDSMFNGCTSLSSVTVHFKTWPSGALLNNWLSGVAPTGIFRCPAELPDERGNGRIPEGWTKVDL